MTILTAGGPLAGDGRGITFDEALGLAAVTPSVEGAERAVAAKREGDARLGPLSSNPVVVVQPGAATRGGSKGIEGQAALYQSFNLAGLPSARRAAAAKEEAQLVAEARATALARKLDAARAWVDLWAAEAANRLAGEELALASQLAARIRKAAEAAALTRADAADADAYEAEARLLALSVEGEVTDRGFDLARALGRAAGTPPATAGDLPALPVPPRDRWPDLVARAGGLPAARALALFAEAEAARGVEARAARGLDLQLGIVVQRDAARRDVLFGSVGLTLPLFERGHREAAALDAAAARHAGEAEDAARQAATELARAFHELEHTGEVLRELEKGLVPAALESARLREAALRAGDATILEVLVARRNAAAARGRELRARAAHAWAGVKVTLLLAQLPREGPEPTS